MFDQLFAQAYAILNTPKYNDSSKRRRLLELWNQSLVDADDIYLRGLKGVLTNTIAAELSPSEIVEYMEFWANKVFGGESV